MKRCFQKGFSTLLENLDAEQWNFQFLPFQLREKNKCILDNDVLMLSSIVVVGVENSTIHVTADLQIQNQL